jgi:hypothetical protein
MKSSAALLLLALCLGASACAKNSAAGPQMVEGMLPVGTVDMQQVQAAYIGSVSGGSGTLFFKDGAYPFTVGGAGIGGLGASTIDATGEVYGLANVDQFAGAYGQGRYGFAFGDRSAGDLWMKNENGVILHLKAKRTGLMLSLGGDAVVITMNQ